MVCGLYGDWFVSQTRAVNVHHSFLDPVVDAVPPDEAGLGAKGIVCTQEREILKEALAPLNA